MGFMSGEEDEDPFWGRYTDVPLSSRGLTVWATETQLQPLPGSGREEEDLRMA